MGNLLILLLILGLAGCLALKFNRKIEETIATSIFIYIIMLYFSGLVLDSLLSGLFLGIILGIVCFVYVSFKIIQKSNAIRELLLTPGLLFYTVLFLWVCVMNLNRMFTGWDEFSHWGLVVKNMCFFDTFGTHPDSTVFFQDYPPATALWQYFVVKINACFEEANVYCAYGWMITAMYMPILKKCNWKNCFFGLVSLGIVYCLPAIFADSYLVLLYVDAALGIMLFYLLYNAYFEELFDKFFIIQLTTGMVVLSLTKSTGCILALIVWIILSIDNFVINKRFVGWKKVIPLELITLGGVWFAKYSWNWHIKITNTGSAWNTSQINLNSIVSLIKGEGLPYQYETIHNFFIALPNKPMRRYFFNMSYSFFFIFVLAILTVMVILYSKQKRKKAIIYSVGTIIGLLIYTIGLLGTYVYSFSEGEAIDLASYERYLSTIYIGATGFGVIAILDLGYEKGKKYQTVLGTICILASLVLIPAKEFGKLSVMSHWHANKTVKTRSEYMEINRYINLFDYKSDKVWFISQGDNGYDSWIYRTELVPVDTNISGWNIVEPGRDGNPWAVYLSADEWLDILRNEKYTYVYLHRIDDQFIDSFGCSFIQKDNIKEKQLYRVDTELNRLVCCEIE